MGEKWKVAVTVGVECNGPVMVTISVKFKPEIVLKWLQHLFEQWVKNGKWW